MSSTDPALSQTHTLHVNDVYHKQQWLNCLRTAIAQQQGAPPKAAGQVVESERSTSTSPLTIENEEEKKENSPPPASSPKLRPHTVPKTSLDQSSPAPIKRKETGV